ncbi:MAG: hypothetical protein MMC33_010114 [Icmadophila ericetorum]|nr:hypothetical protein [Icmadophila ericetorum]
MSHPKRTPLPSLRNPSLRTSSQQSTSTANPHLQSQTDRQSAFLAARIAEKKSELENLKQLRDLSAVLAEQMGGLEERLKVLGDGTEAVATVLSNWHNVLRAVQMASSKAQTVKVPKPRVNGDTSTAEDKDPPPLPQTLVRIPTEQP